MNERDSGGLMDRDANGRYLFEYKPAASHGTSADFKARQEARRKRVQDDFDEAKQKVAQLKGRK